MYSCNVNLRYIQTSKTNIIIEIQILKSVVWFSKQQSPSALIMSSIPTNPITSEKKRVELILFSAYHSNAMGNFQLRILPSDSDKLCKQQVFALSSNICLPNSSEYEGTLPVEYNCIQIKGIMPIDKNCLVQWNDKYKTV